MGIIAPKKRFPFAVFLATKSSAIRGGGLGEGWEEGKGRGGEGEGGGRVRGGRRGEGERGREKWGGRGGREKGE